MNDDLRPDLPDDALRSSLRHAADDVAFAVPDLLPRARAARRRRRVVGTTVTAGVVVAAVALMPPLFDTSRAVPAAPTPSPTAPASVTGSLPITADYALGVGFGETDALSRTSEGQDFTAPADTPVHAVAAGIVLDAVDDPQFGINVVIRHDNGGSTLYAHLSESSVSPGDAVEAGQQIGTVGMTGRAFEPHLHLRYYGPGLTPGGSDASDPLAFLRSLDVEVG